MTIAEHMLNRIARDPRLAYYFDPYTASMEMLTEAYARENNLELEEFREQFFAKLKFERPRCSNCECSECSR